MKVVLREEKSGVSEVVGTILILAMTVVLFSTIIIWVSNIPTPSAQTRVDIRSTMNPIYSAGVEIGVDITLIHQGGEALAPVPTVLYVTSQRGSNPPQTDIVILHPYNGLLPSPSGLLGGGDSLWGAGGGGGREMGAVSCMSPPFPLLSFDGSIYWMNKKVRQGHVRPARFVVKVVEQFSGGGT